MLSSTKLFKYFEEKLCSIIAQLVSLIDKIFENEQREHPYLYGISCLLISTKFHENDFVIPEVLEFGKISNEIEYSPKEITQCEVECLNILGFNLNYENSYDYLMIVLNRGIILKNEKIDHQIEIEKEDILSNFEKKFMKNMNFPLKISEKNVTRRSNKSNLEEIYTLPQIILKKTIFSI